MKMVAIVPARKFDSQIHNKNILDFGGSNLLVHKIRQLKRVGEISRIIVSSDDLQYLEMARLEGVDTQLRPKEYSDETAEFGDFVEYMVNGIDANHIVWASPTSPLVDEVDFSSSINIYFGKIGPDYDSLISVTQITRHLLDSNGPLTFRFSGSQRNSSLLPTLYRFTNGISIAPRKSMLKWRYNWGFMPYQFHLSSIKSVDVCTMVDYDLARMLYTKRTGDL
jgi:pseudaminic acid cytidylyltransferase